MSGVTTDQGELKYLRSAVGVYLNPPSYSMGLFFTNFYPNETTALGSFTEVSGGGYARKVLTPASYTMANGDPTTATFTTLTWTFSAAVGNIYGYFIVDTVSGLLTVAERFSAPVNIDAVGKQVVLLHKIELRDTFDQNGTGFCFSNEGESRFLQEMIRKRTADNGTHTLKFYSNDATPTESSGLGDFTGLLNAFTMIGYEQSGHNMEPGLDTDPTVTALMSYTATNPPYMEYIYGGSTTTIYGYIVTDDQATTLIGGERFSTPITLYLGDKLRITPKFRFGDDDDY
jgi:hypothetical protein